MNIAPPLQEEIAELQQRLVELKDRSRCLEQQIQQEEQQVEAEELEASVLRSCSTAQLRDMSRTLQDLVASENRTQISVSRPPSMLRSAPYMWWFACLNVTFVTWKAVFAWAGKKRKWKKCKWKNRELNSCVFLSIVNNNAFILFEWLHEIIKNLEPPLASFTKLQVMNEWNMLFPGTEIYKWR